MRKISIKRMGMLRSSSDRLAYNSTFKAAKKKVVAKGRGEKAKAKAQAWKEFSRYVRLRDADRNGMVKCCTCSVVKHWKAMHAGHFLSRRYASTFLDLRNVHAQCPGCNRFRSGAPLEYDAYLKTRYTQETPEQLRQLARQEANVDAHEYRELAKVYKLKADQIETQNAERTP